MPDAYYQTSMRTKIRRPRRLEYRGMDSLEQGVLLVSHMAYIPPGYNVTHETRCAYEDASPSVPNGARSLVALQVPAAAPW